MVLLLKLCTQTEYYHSLPPSYFDGINRTKREIITGAAIFFVLDKLCVSFLIALRLPLYLLSVSTLLFLYFVFSHNRYVFKRTPNANVFLKIENEVWEMHLEKYDYNKRNVMLHTVLFIQIQMMCSLEVSYDYYLDLTF